MRDLQDKATKDFAHGLPIIRERWAEMEAQIESERIEVEREASSVRAAGRADLAAGQLTDFMASNAQRILETAEKLLEEI
jgi:hypothetical protein